MQGDPENFKSTNGNFDEVPVNKSMRYRVNVSTTSKGAKSFECTVEGTGYTEAEILERSDSLVKKLEERYPAQVEVK